MKKYLVLLSVLVFMVGCKKSTCPGTSKEKLSSSKNNPIMTSKAPKTARYKTRQSGRGLLKR